MINRESKRKTMKAAKGQAKQKFTLMELQKAISIALEMKKESRGHLFSRNMVNQESKLPMCVFCGVDQSVSEGECDYWFLTIVDRIQTILINPQFFVDMDEEANYIQHGDEYAGIRIPVEEKK